MKASFEEAIKKHKDEIPVPIISIVKGMGLEIYETGDFLKHQSGSIRKEGEKFVIYINTYQPLSRKRFTIAHELAHYVKHKDKLDSGEEFVSETKQPVLESLNRQVDKQMSEEERKMEVEANQFAAEILMPEEAFKKIWEKANTVEEVAVKFVVSQSAATIRANNLFGSFMM